MTNEFLVIGHRGAKDLNEQGIYENTLPAFEEAYQAGADGIEFDVYCVQDADGKDQIVVIHDDDLHRTTNGTGPVMDKSFEELRQLDAGGGQKIPTIQEVLAVTERQSPDARGIVNIELKGPGCALAVAELLKKYLANGWAADTFIISSFDHPQLTIFHEAMPKLDLAVLVDDKQFLAYGNSIQPAIDLAKQIDAIAVNPGLQFSNMELVKQINDVGLKCYIWTGETDKDVLKVKSFNAAGVFANNPRSALILKI